MAFKILVRRPSSGVVLIVLGVAAVFQAAVFVGNKGSATKDDSRGLSVNLGGGNCQWTPAEDIPPADPLYSTLIVGYPGSGKRLVWQMMEALTGGFSGDDWDLSQHGTHVVSIKSSYPHPESVWNWGDAMDQSVLVIRNPRNAIPSYASMKSELLYSDGYDASFLRREYVYTARPSLEEWVNWRDANFENELRRWCMLIDFWMQNGETLEADGAETPGQDPNCQTNMVECRPKTVIAYEKLSHRATGAAELAKLSGILDGHANVPLIEAEARDCVYNQTMDNEQPGWRNNAHRIGLANDELMFTMTQLLSMKTLFIDMQNKYTAWGADANAQFIVDCMSSYLANICAEIILVSMG